MKNNTVSTSTKSPQVTLRGTIVGLGIGTLILLSNFQFGLQTGWVSMMSLPAALLAYAIFKAAESFPGLKTSFTPQENVYVQSVAVAVATGPLAYGFIGIIPAIEKLLTPEESGLVENLKSEVKELVEVTLSDFHPFQPSWKLLIWSLGLAFFGVFFAVPLREEFIIKQKLKFPSGSATATLISVFHNFPLRTDNENNAMKDREEEEEEEQQQHVDGIEGNTQKKNNPNHSYITRDGDSQLTEDISGILPQDTGEFELDQFDDQVTNHSCIDELEKESYSRDITILLFTALFSSVYTLTTYFIPQIRIIPIFGTYLSQEYLINFTLSPAYIGQGIIMGFQTTCGMLTGMILGWCIISPFVKYMGWAPGETGSWKDGAEGWIMWISLSVMIADSLVSLGLMAYKSINSLFVNSVITSQWSLLKSTPDEESHLLQQSSQITLSNETSGSSTTMNHNGEESNSYSSIEVSNDDHVNSCHYKNSDSNMIISSITLLSKEFKFDSHDENSIHLAIPIIGLILCCPILILSMKIIFGSIVPAWLLLLTIPVSLILSLIGVKSLGETDLNPVSGIGKLSQLLTALVIPSSRPGSVLINLIVGAISEATAQQAGDLMQDLKAGYLLHGSPQAQFLAQIFGSIWGVLIAAPMYRWYDKIYEIPGPLFKIPTAVIWIDCARLVNGHELPENVGKFVIIFGIIFLILSFIRGIINENNKYYKFSRWIPSGVAVGIGIYNPPSFTLARFLGGLISWYWIKKLRERSTPESSLVGDGKITLIIFSSGLVLGEGLFSVVNMVLTSIGVPHL